NAISAGRVGHAYLFCGPRGTGKTTTARLLAKAVNCLNEELSERPCDTCANCRAIREGRFLDLIEIDAASNTGVDDIRDLRDKINFSPSEGRFKVYVIDEVHMLSTAAFNALLKTLEEPPPHAKFVLATTEEHKVPMTIKSRCQQFNFRLLTQQEIASRLRWMAKQEEIALEPEALALIARQGAGSIRDAESLLDQLVTARGDTITLERARMVLGTASMESVVALTDAWLAADAAAGLDVIHEALATGADARQFARQMVDYVRQVLLLQTAGEEVLLSVPEHEQERMAQQAQRASREELIAAIKGFNEAALTPSSSWQPQLPLEMAFIELLPAKATGAPPPSTRPESTPKREPAAKKIAETAAQEAAQEAAHGAAHKPEREGASAEADDDEATEKNLETEASTESEGGEAPKKAPEPERAQPATITEANASEQETEGEGAEQKPEGEASRVTLEAVKGKWPTMVSSLGEQDKNLPPLLAMCKPLAVEGNAVVLGFDYPVLRDKFRDKAQAVEMVAAEMSALLGHKCTVRCVITGEYSPPAPRTAPSLEDEFYALADELGGEPRKT
ncbi:MAG: DNA polymerase III subunit gamma/tau, partial [Candidatus Promineifilaceae bacterium]|nr:DNA polymerase III subunit gamma/tau [Candidatus Promineifilaceae bacterium]